MLKESSVKLSGNDRFEGFGIELVYELSQMLGFNYTFRLQEDGVYGSLVNGQWNGMVKELLEHVSCTFGRETVTNRRFPLHEKSLCF